MNAIQGTNRLVFEDTLWYFGKLVFLYITLPLTLMWIIIGISFDLEDTLGAVSGPSFFFIPFYGAYGYKSLLPIAVGLGSTRTQLLKSFYFIALSFTMVFVLILNILQSILYLLYDNGISSVNISHLARLFIEDYQFFSYLFIDLGFFLFLFGISFLGSCIYYRVGMKKMTISMVAIFIPLTILFYAGILDTPIEWVMGVNINPVLLFILLGIAGLILLFMAYPIIRNVSLEKKSVRF